MGNRISVQFKNGEELSPCVYSHWGSLRVASRLKEFVHDLKKIRKESGDTWPLGRGEPGSCLAHFVGYLYSSDFNFQEKGGCLSIDPPDCPNLDDYGHVVVDTETLTIIRS